MRDYIFRIGTVVCNEESGEVAMKVKCTGELIHCIECKYYVGDGYDECQLISLNPITSSINHKQWYSDFYCAFGEREEEDEKIF